MFSPVSPDSLFSSLAAYFGHSFLNDNWPFLLILSFKALLLFRVSWKLGETDPGPHKPSQDWHGVLIILKSASLTFSGKLSRSSHFSCLLFTPGCPTKHFKLDMSQILSFQPCLSSVSYLGEHLYQITQGRNLGVTHSFIESQCSRHWGFQRLQTKNLCPH